MLQRAAQAAMMAFCAVASANPVGPQVAAGSAGFSASGAHLTVTNAPGTIINWRGFSIGAGELTRFVQQSASSAVLNRVVGGEMSSLLGALQSNGRVFLINPNGIVLGAGARIDTAGFVASTLNIADRDFLAGKLRFEGEGGLVRNEGAVHASGDIILVGGRVENAGLIRSETGSVLLAAGRSLTITGPDAQGVQFALQAPADAVLNLGTLEATNAVGLFAGTLRHSGDIRATSASMDRAGKVTLLAQAQAVVDGNATIGARGAAGGGEVLISAVTTFVGEATRIDASAAARGNGGRVIVWADDAAHVHGSIAVRGGEQGGDGGFVETSGRRTLEFTRAPDLAAPAGRAGRWLIDPTDITIDASNEAAIETALNAGGTVTLATSGAGLANGDININVQIDKTSGAGATLELQAHNNINLNASIVSTSNQLDLALLPDSDGAAGGAVNWTLGGDRSIALNGGVMTLPVGKTMNVEAVGFRGLSNLTFDNFGTVNYTSGGFFGWSMSLNDGAVLNNAGTFRLLNPAPPFANQGNQGLESFSGGGTFLNTGTLQVAYPSGSPSYLFRNSGGTLSFQSIGGTIDAGGSTLDVQSASSHSGAMTINNGALVFSQGAHGFAAGSSLGGSGLLRLAGTATTTFADTTVNSALQLDAGTVNLNGTLAFAPGSSFSWSNGATVVGAGAARRIEVQNGAAATINSSNGGAVLSNVVFDNAGTVDYTSGGFFGWTLHLDNGTQLNNAGLFQYVSGGQGIESFGGTGAFNNSGTLRNAYAAGGPSYAFRSSGGTPVFNNLGGTLDSGGSGGTLDIGVGGTHSGAMTLVNDNVVFSGGTHTFSGASFAGAGALNLSGASFVFDNTAWNKSINFGSGSVSIPTSAIIPGGASIAINHAVGGAGALMNQGTLDASNGAISGSLVNEGALSVAAGSSLTVGGGLVVNGGTVSGAGTIVGNVVNNGGTVAAGASPGTLTIDGDYTQGAGGTFLAELGGTTQGVDYDLLQVTGTANLGGTLGVALLGGFTGAPGDTFDVATYGARTGDFATFSLPAGYTITGTPNPAAYQLAIGAIAAPPSPPAPPPAATSAGVSAASPSTNLILTLFGDALPVLPYGADRVAERARTGGLSCR